jgi:hypothetical protein
VNKIDENMLMFTRQGIAFTIKIKSPNIHGYEKMYRFQKEFMNLIGRYDISSLETTCEVDTLANR